MALAISVLQANTPAMPLSPSGKWTVAYEPHMCLASRTFGAAGELTLTLRPSPVGDGLEIMIVRAGSPDRRVVWFDEIKLIVDPGTRSFDGNYKAWRSHEAGGRVIIINAKQSALDALADDSMLTIAAKREGSLQFRMTNLAKLKPVLDDCKVTVAKHWGVDPAELAAIATPAEAIEQTNAPWVRVTDYPDDALRKHQSGMSTILWTIGLDGRVSNCKPVSSSGVPSLDTAACAAVVSRGRYRPALDRAGKPMISHGMRRVVWLIPSSG